MVLGCLVSTDANLYVPSPLYNFVSVLIQLPDSIRIIFKYFRVIDTLVYK